MPAYRWDLTVSSLHSTFMYVYIYIYVYMYICTHTLGTCRIHVRLDCFLSTFYIYFMYIYVDMYTYIYLHTIWGHAAYTWHLTVSCLHSTCVHVYIYIYICVYIYIYIQFGDMPHAHESSKKILVLSTCDDSWTGGSHSLPNPTVWYDVYIHMCPRVCACVYARPFVRMYTHKETRIHK